jgi:hypothetical protein
MKKRNGLSKAISIFLVTMITLSLTACGENNSSKESKITTAEKLGTEEPVTVTTGFVEPDIDIDPGAIITTETKTETEIETQTETETETETTTEASTSAPQGQYAYTYTIYDGIVLSMDVNVDDYVVIANDGTPCFRLYQLAGDMGWMSMGLYDKDAVEASKSDLSIVGPSWWSYSNGEMRTQFDLDYSDSEHLPAPFSDKAPFRGMHINFIEQDTVKPYYTDDEINHQLIDINIRRGYDDVQYRVSGYSCAISRDDFVLIAYILWFMPQHCGEAEPLCSQFDEKWGRGTGATNVLYFE